MLDDRSEAYAWITGKFAATIGYTAEKRLS
jgi:hypothetical protein